MLTEFLPSLSHIFTSSSEKDPKVARSNAAKSRIKHLVSTSTTNFRGMLEHEFKAFVETHYDDFITHQIDAFGLHAANMNCIDILKMLKESNISLCKTVMENHHNIFPELKQILVQTAGPHRPVPVIFAKNRSALGKPIRPGSTVPRLYSNHENHGLRGTDIPLFLGSPQLRLKGLLGILTPGFCSKSIAPEEVAGILKKELNRQSNYTNP